MAKSSSLNVRVVEGRALPAKDVSGSSDPYCIVKVDDEVVARTATIWRSLSPFWGEEYTVHLPLDFHHLAFYVLDEDTVGHDDIIGKISLSREAITADPRGIDSWINLSRVDPDAEVQGEIFLAVQMLEDVRGRCLRCHVLQARDLAPRDISGTSDPFARVFWGSQSLETSIIKKTRFPHWDEVLELQEIPGSPSPLRVELWDWDMVGKNDFLGMVEFPPQVLQHNPPDGWFRLQPFPRAEEDSGGSLGALRLKVRLTEDCVLPSQYYQPLRELLMESVLGPAEGPRPPLLPPVLVQEDAASPLAVLEELTSGDCRQELATKLVKLFLGQGLTGPFLDYLTRREVARTTDPNTLFRSNSLASKSMEQFMKLVGMPYLHEVLRSVINRVFEEKKYMELDPCKMDLGRTRRISFKGAPSEEHVREASLGLLTGYLGPIVDAIVGSVGRCPPAMRLAFKQLRQRVEERFPQAEHEMRSSIPVSHIRAVERVDEGAFQLPHVMQVVTQDGAGALHTTYLQCKNVNELNQWVSALRKASAPNPDKLASCHPGAFRSGHWTCCLQAERSASGCSRTHSAVTLGDWSDPLDPDAETQMVYRQLLLGRDRLRMKFLEDSNMHTTLEADPEQGSRAMEGACTDALARQREAAARLLEVLADLDQAHEEFQQQEQGKVVWGPLRP
ncbi:rasGAP-activating-like protein 1 isoform 6-T7 [Dama dama]